MSSRPPKYFLRFFRWFCHPRLQKPIEGDLMELYEERLKELGKRKADRKFRREVMQLFRPSIIKPADGTYRLNNYGMLKHNLLIAIRSSKKFKGTFIINLLGLAFGLAATMLVYLWVNDELNIDKFAEKGSERHVQVLINVALPTGVQTSEMTPNPLAQAMEEEFPEVEKGISIVASTYYQGVISHEDQYLRVVPQFVGDGYLDVFQCDFITGDKEKAFLDKKSVVVSEKAAINLFGEASQAIGRTVSFKAAHFTDSYVVSGVFAPLTNASVKFDLLFSYDVFLTGRPKMNQWSHGGSKTHLVLSEGVNLDEFNAKIKEFLKKFKDTKQELFTQKYSDKYLFGKYENGSPVAGRMVYLQIFSLIALFVLVIACINYMNLSTAQASRRIKEIGVKKAIGVQRKALIYQHFGESLFTTFLSLALAVAIVILLIPQFNQITGKELSINTISEITVPIVVITFLTGLFSGIYPGIYLSSFKPVLALKGKIGTGLGGLWVRKGLVVFQFAISVTLIISVITIYKQINFIQEFNLGYNKDHVISFRKEGKLVENAEAFTTEVKNLPGVVQISHMWGSLPGQIGGGSYFRWKNQDPEQRKIDFTFIEGGYDISDVLGLELKAGRFLSRDFPTDKMAVVLNETAAKIIGNGDSVLGQKFSKRDDYKIVGVVKDFHFEGLHDEIKPFFFTLNTRGENFIAKIQPENQSETINRIKELYARFNPGYPFELKFLDENYQKLYDEERRIATLSKYFAGVAIALSCLGLLALTAFSTQRRFKEIAIRKILGSSSLRLTTLLSREFIFLVLLAILIAMPVAYYLMRNWLDGYAYRINLQPTNFIMAGALMLLVAWLTIMIQTARSAKVKVTESLRTNE